MKFLIEILSGSSFEIEVDYRDTLLEVKQKIEKSQRILVSKQTLIVDGVVILREYLNLEQCQIVHNSRLQLDVSADDNPNHNNDNQMSQTEPSPWISIEEYFEGQDWPLTAEEIRKIYSYKLETNQGISKVQDSPVMVGSSNKNHQVLHQTEQSPPSKSVKETVNIQDSSVKVGSNKNVSKMTKVGRKKNNNDDQVPQMKQSSQSNSVKEITKIQDSPMKVRSNKKVLNKWMVVFVSQYPGESILVSVNATDEVKKLRDEMVQSQQRGHIKLPQDGYFFTHKKEVLNEDQSYEWNGVKDADTIEMVPRHVTRGS